MQRTKTKKAPVIQYGRWYKNIFTGIAVNVTDLVKSNDRGDSTDLVIYRRCGNTEDNIKPLHVFSACYEEINENIDINAESIKVNIADAYFKSVIDNK